jgi:capsular polysaccharide biosynthesis protein
MNAAELELGGEVRCEDVLSKSDDCSDIVRLRELAPKVDYDRPAPVTLDRQYLAPELNPLVDEIFAQTTAPGASISLFELNNALVFGQGAVVTGGGRLVRDTALEFLNHGNAPDGAHFRNGGVVVNASPRARLGGVSLLVKRPWYRNYGHWLIDLMPIIPLVSQCGLQIDRILYGDVPPGALKDAMVQVAKTHFSSAEIMFCADDHVLHCETLLYVQPLHVPPLFKHPIGPQTARAAALRSVPSDNPKRRRLYVSRNGASMRRLTNDEAVLKLLRRYEFEVFHPEVHSFEDQVEHFRTAELVVGVKGAGLTSAMFCDPGAQVLVLSPSRFIDPFFWDLLSPLGIRYSEIFCRDSADGGPADHDFAAELEKIEAFLEAL